jgi:hypothetical protein
MTRKAAAKKPGGAAKPAAAAAPRVGYSERSRIDKLGLKDGMRVAIVGVDDPWIRQELAERTSDVSESRPKRDTDLVLFGVDSVAALAGLKTLEKFIKRNGMIWAVWPKGQRHIREDDVRRAAIAHGFVDVKVMAFSETLSGLKLVIPVARRWPSGRT